MFDTSMQTACFLPSRTKHDYFLSTKALKLEDNILSLVFTQEMTLALLPEQHKLDIRILLKNDCALALKEKQTVEVVDVLHDGVLGDEPTTRIQTIVLSNDVSTEFDGYFNDDSQEFEAQFGVLYNGGGVTDYSALNANASMFIVNAHDEKIHTTVHTIFKSANSNTTVSISEDRLQIIVNTKTWTSVVLYTTKSIFK